MYYKTKEEADLMRLFHKVLCYIEGVPYKFIFIVQPFCEHIFEPQEGDKNIDGYVFDAKLQAWKKFSVMTPFGEDIYNMREPHELPISQRNGKAFIMPERE